MTSSDGRRVGRIASAREIACPVRLCPRLGYALNCNPWRVHLHIQGKKCTFNIYPDTLLLNMSDQFLPGLVLNQPLPVS